MLLELDDVEAHRQPGGAVRPLDRKRSDWPAPALRVQTAPPSPRCRSLSGWAAHLTRVELVPGELSACRAAAVGRGSGLLVLGRAAPGSRGRLCVLVQAERGRLQRSCEQLAWRRWPRFDAVRPPRCSATSTATWNLTAGRRSSAAANIRWQRLHGHGDVQVGQRVQDVLGLVGPAAYHSTDRGPGRRAAGGTGRARARSTRAAGLSRSTTAEARCARASVRASTSSRQGLTLGGPGIRPAASTSPLPSSGNAARPRGLSSTSTTLRQRHARGQRSFSRCRRGRS